MHALNRRQNKLTAVHVCRGTRRQSCHSFSTADGLLLAAAARRVCAGWRTEHDSIILNADIVTGGWDCKPGGDAIMLKECMQPDGAWPAAELAAESTKQQ